MLTAVCWEDCVLCLEFEYNTVHGTERLLSMHHDTGKMSSFFRGSRERDEVVIAKPVNAALKALLYTFFESQSSKIGWQTMPNASIVHGGLKLHAAHVSTHMITFGLLRVVIRFDQVSGDFQSIFCDVPALSTENKVSMLFKTLTGLTDFGRYLLESNWQNIDQAERQNNQTNVVMFKARDTELRFFLEMVTRQIEQVDALTSPEAEEQKNSSASVSHLDKFKA